MSLSTFDIFKIGIGPSSSHTMGPMKAAAAFVRQLEADGAHQRASRLSAQLYGSLALTGRGHCTDRAVVLGFLGEEPETIDPDSMEGSLATVARERAIEVGGRRLKFDPERDLVFLPGEFLPQHPNGMRFAAVDDSGEEIAAARFYSLGGGFIAREGETEGRPEAEAAGELAYPFTSARELLAQCERHGLTIAELVMANESAWRDEKETLERLDALWEAMQSCVARGSRTEGVLPGSLAVTRRAPRLFRSLEGEEDGSDTAVLDWVNAWALAVNEENAAGGRVVTAPTNGAAGIVPAVMHYYACFHDGADRAGIHRFLLCSAAIGMLYKLNASISGAEMGCQGEVGVACSMAAAGLVAASGGSNTHIENAAEIGMEHNLGLTCDPVAGLVQIPCIERNAMGAVKAINAARIARHGVGDSKVSLDQVIETMRQTGHDMSRVYKETSQGGLAVNVIEC